MHQSKQKYLQSALHLFNVSDHYHYCNDNDKWPEEPDSWDVIDNLDKEAKQQSFLLIAAVALSFLESYERNLKPVRIPKWEHQKIDWNEHVPKLLHENRFHHEYRKSFEAVNQLLEILRPSITVYAVK